MTKYENLRAYKSSKAEEKLGILKSELRSRIVVIRGFATILKNQLTTEPIMQLSDDWKLAIEEIYTAGEDLDEIIEILT